MKMRLLWHCVAIPFLVVALFAQDAKTTEQQKAQAALQEKAVQLLDQLVAEARGLKLPENRLRMLWQAGDLFWPRDEARARTLFSQVGAGLSEMLLSQNPTERRYLELLQPALQMRQEFLNLVARRDPKLAYEILLSSRPNLPPTVQNVASAQNAEANLELSITTQMANSDPKLAVQNAEAALDKGQYPSSLARLLAQLQDKDKDAAAKLKDKLLKRLRAEPMFNNSSASNLSLSLLRPGPRTNAAVPVANPNTISRPALDETGYRELLDLVVTAALTTVPRTQGQAMPSPPVPPSPTGATPASTATAIRTEIVNAQTLQNNARNLLSGLQSILPQIDKYAPARAPQVRQKLAEMGMRTNAVTFTPELNNLMQNGTASDLLKAAPTAGSPEMQTMLYRQAAYKAINEGNMDEARKIAGQHLNENQREGVMREAERQQTLQSAAAGKLEDAKQALAAMKTDGERVNWLTQAAALGMKKNDPKLAAQFLDDARLLLGRRAENYQQFDPSLRVARGYAEVDAGRAIEVLTPGIEQLNEMLAAAAVLTGFELRVFKDGEMMLQGGGQLGNMVSRYGQAIATIARQDFDRAQTAVDQFQRTEARLLARMAIARGILEVRQENENGGFVPSFSFR